jgi:hypothetical protein
LRTVAEAIAKASCIALELEQGEVKAEFRPAVSADGPSGRCVEIYVYDSLAGGAGFAKAVGGRCREVLELALSILGDCDCDQSCYKCLRSFRNKHDHDKLDRRIGDAFLRYTLFGRAPVLPPERERRALALVEEDLRRQLGGAIEVALDASVDFEDLGRVTIPLLVTTKAGKRLAVVVTHSLTPTAPSDPSLGELAEYTTGMPLRCYHELLLRRALPAVITDIMTALGLADA